MSEKHTLLMLSWTQLRSRLSSPYFIKKWSSLTLQIFTDYDCLLQYCSVTWPRNKIELLVFLDSRLENVMEMSKCVVWNLPLNNFVLKKMSHVYCTIPKLHCSTKCFVNHWPLLWSNKWQSYCTVEYDIITS